MGWSDKAWRLAFFYLWRYGLPVGVLVGVLLMIWMCWSAQPTEEERERRRIFEERLAEMERKHAQRRAGGKKEAEGQVNDTKETADDSTEEVNPPDSTDKDSAEKKDD